jgi:hypothetical protein
MAFLNYHEGVGQFQQGSFRDGMACDPSSPVGSGAFFGGAGGTSSRGDESALPSQFLSHILCRNVPKMQNEEYWPIWFPLSIFSGTVPKSRSDQTF